MANGRRFEPSQLFSSSLKREIVKGILGKETQPAQNGIESAEIMLCGVWGSGGLELARQKSLPKYNTLNFYCLAFADRFNRP
jgi:hypothetical protein